MTLKEFVKNNDANVTTLARKLKVSRQMIYKYIDGKSIPSMKTAYLIEKHTEGKITLYDWVRKPKEVDSISIDNI